MLYKYGILYNNINFIPNYVWVAWYYMHFLLSVSFFQCCHWRFDLEYCFNFWIRYLSRKSCFIAHCRSVNIQKNFS